MIVGLTGAIGAGKSTVCSMFASLGVPIISADLIGQEILKQATIVEQIIEHFGTSYLTEDQSINRNKLRQKIFKSPADKLWLEQLLHPLIKQQIQMQTAIINSPYCIVEIPLLLEAKFQDCVDTILSIICSQELKIQRAMHRDNTEEELIRAIVNSQISDNERIALSDSIIDNSCDLNNLEKQVCKKNLYYLDLVASKT